MTHVCDMHGELEHLQVKMVHEGKRRWMLKMLADHEMVHQCYEGSQQMSKL